jgi:iron complex outermembrane receptor protein
MKKNIIALITMCFQGFVVFAQPVNQIYTIEQDLNPLDIIEDKRTPNLPLANMGVQILSSKDIQKLPVRNVAEALLFVSGVDVRSRNTFAQSDISLMGSSYDQILILIDGVPMRDPQTGHHQMNLPIDLNQVERIEVYKGSAARMFGAGALAGAINIVTKAPGSQKLNVLSYWGANGKKDSATGEAYTQNVQQIALGFKGEKAGHTVQLRRLFTNGFQYNSGVEQQQVFTNSQFVFKNNRKIQWINGLFNNSFGAKDFYASPYDTDAFEQVKTMFTGINADLTWKRWRVVPRLYHRYNEDHYVFIKSKPEVYQNFHFGSTSGAELHLSKANKWGLVALGGETRMDWLRSNNLGKHQRQFYSGYIEQRFNPWSNLNVIIGSNFQYTLLSDEAQKNNQGWKAYPAVDIAYKTDYGQVYVHTGKGSRLPTYTDWYYKDSRNQGNPLLVAEDGFIAETGFLYKSDEWNIQGCYYYRKVNNQIDYILTTMPDLAQKWTPLNVGISTFTGFDFVAQWNNKPTTDQWFYFLNAGVKATLLSSMMDTQDLPSRYAAEHLTQQFIGQLAVGQKGKIQHQLMARHFQRMGQATYTTILDWRSQLNLEKVNVFFDINNLNNQQYILSGFVQMPRRWFNVGVQFQM